MPTVRDLTQVQLDKIQIDEGLVFVNYGETDEIKLGPTRGGGEFTATQTIRDIDYDGKKGKTKGLQAVEEINAVLKVTTLFCSQEVLAMALPSASIDATTKVITSGDTGLIPASKYVKNVTMFSKLADGKYKKITIFNAMHEGDFNFGAKPKAENEHSLELYAHHDATDSAANLYKIEEIDSLPVN